MTQKEMGASQFTIADLVRERTASLKKFAEIPGGAQAAISASLTAIAQKTLEQERLIRTKGWASAFYKSGANELMRTERTRLKAELGSDVNPKRVAQILSEKNIEPVVRAFSAGLSLKELETLRKRGKEIRPGEIIGGRTHSTHEIQPANTLRTTLHRK